jgi:uncharacterized protein YndB with AHSA1/START domain
MIKANKSVYINAPVEKVFAYLEDPSNLPEVWPSMVEVRNIKDEADGKKNYEWTYKMAGVNINGFSETLEYEANKRIVVHNPKGIESKFTWDYIPEDNGTRINVEVEYTIPLPVLGKLAESIIIKQNEKEADTLLANIKSKMENQ